MARPLEATAARAPTHPSVRRRTGPRAERQARSRTMVRANRGALLLILSIAISGCWLPGQSNNDRASPALRPRRPGQAPPTLAWTASLPLLPEDKPRSIRYRQAMLRWRTATVAFSLGRYPRSAEAFLEVADALKTERPHPHASTFAVARCLAYENAAHALSMLADVEAAQARLESATADEAACPITLRRAFKNVIHGPDHL